MIHPVFRLVAAEPQMVADHLGNYAELLGDELRAFGGGWTRRVLLQLAALGLAVVAVALAGVSAIAWASTAIGALHAPWVLVAVPLLPALAAAVCLWVARSGTPAEGFAALRRQLAEDSRMLREVAA